MFKQFSTQATAFGLAALATLATLGSLQNLAASDAAHSQIAQRGKPVQQVVVIGQRVARS